MSPRGGDRSTPAGDPDYRRSAGPYDQAAGGYLQAGWTSPIPLGRPGDGPAKSPVPKGFTGNAAKVPSDAQIERWRESHGALNIGLHMAPELGVIGIDVDDYTKETRDPETGDVKLVVKAGGASLRALEAELGPLPWKYKSSARGFENVSGIHFFRVPLGLTFKANPANDIEIVQPSHRYAVVSPSVHPDTGERYLWWRRDGASNARPPKLDSLPRLPSAWVEALSVDVGPVLVAGDLDGVAVTEWLGSEKANPCRAMRNTARREVEKIEQAGSRHDTVTEAVMALARLRAEGHRGVVSALEGVHAAFIEVAGSDREGGTEWLRMVNGAVSKLAGSEIELHGPRKSDCPNRNAELLDGIDNEIDAARLGANLWPSPSQPLAVAERVVDDLFTLTDPDGATEGRTGAQVTLTYWRGDFYEWPTADVDELGREIEGSGPPGAWRPVEIDELRARLYALLSEAEYIGAPKGENEPGAVLGWNPNKTKMSNLIEALAATVHRPARYDIEGHTETHSRIPFANGVLSINRDTGATELFEHSPSRFLLSALPFEYSPSLVGERGPKVWLKFLASLEVDAEVIALLQEWFGYVISGETSKHKFLYLYGATRAGKGVITRTLQRLVGRANFVSPNVNQLATNFGLAPTIGKSLITINDARFRGVKSGELVERLLNLTGDDDMTIDRKNREAWVGQPIGRVMVVSNDLPSISGEQSPAFGKRILGPIHLPKSFYDAEDEHLERKLADELPAIEVWALEGYRRLLAEGRFTRPASAAAAHREIEETLSPVLTFLRERCKPSIYAEDFVPKDQLYAVYRSWANDSGTYCASKVEFGRQLMGASEGRIHEGWGPRPERERIWRGLVLRDRGTRL